MLMGWTDSDWVIYPTTDGLTSGVRHQKVCAGRASATACTLSQARAHGVTLPVACSLSLRQLDL